MTNYGILLKTQSATLTKIKDQKEQFLMKMIWE